ncbi:TnpV protein [Clostridium sp.]|uniref:TnpV protein n=1 Tax=Clostridium sp. TaxID=1506 RepID=UPI00283FF6F1|nr:TnpV protein [Clostridium sp.]MDR3598485.1 TnpV protein [Clostridium sp.]
MLMSGKYWSVALEYLKKNHEERYKELSQTHIERIFGSLNEECNDRLDLMIEQYLKENPLTNPMDTMQSYRERQHAKDYAEEIILKEFIYKIR